MATIDTIADLLRHGNFTPHQAKQIAEAFRLTLADSAASSFGTIMATFDGGGSVVAVGSKCRIQVDFACTIVSAVLLADQTGSAEVDVYSAALIDYPPDNTDSITGGSPITLTAADSIEDTVLTGWDTAIAAGAVLIFNVDSCSTITQLVVKLKVLR